MCIVHHGTLLIWLGSKDSPERQENARKYGWKISTIEGLEGNILVCWTKMYSCYRVAFQNFVLENW